MLKDFFFSSLYFQVWPFVINLEHLFNNIWAKKFNIFHFKRVELLLTFFFYQVSK